ncbi:MAG: aminoacetone oxidase family FAD-binding enzyme, partial [Lachnospiraceae bacterium]|nr:aminoacetone oxidase family FAD-binding enzyme [Lachnospiraceae bacterium]
MRKEEIRHELLIIGGGASGLMAAIAAAREGADAAILEHTDKIGKKLLVTGNGRCNLTNLKQSMECYRSGDLDAAWRVVSAFSQKDTIFFFEELGLLTKDRGGYVYPYSNQAGSLLRVLKTELFRLHIWVYYRTEIQRIYKMDGHFICETADKRYIGKKVILATGSKAAPRTGSDGSGYALAKELGHTVTNVYPALVQLLAKEKCFKMLAGIRADAKVELYLNEKLIAEDIGEVQLTEYGISGIPVFQISRYAAEGLAEGKKVSVEIDFCPALKEQKLQELIEKRIQLGIRMREILCGILNEKLAEYFAESFAPDKVSKADKVGAGVVDESLRKLIQSIKGFKVTIIGTKDFEQCQVCMGGVPLSEID